MVNYIKGGVVGKKVEYTRWLLTENKDITASKIYDTVKERFSTGIDGNIVRDLIREVRPNYVGHTNKKKITNYVDATVPELNSQKRVKITNIYKSFSKYGISTNVISAAVRDAVGIPIVKVQFNTDQISKIEKRLESDRVVCMKLTKHNKVVIVKKDKIHISDGRGTANKARAKNKEE